jgi:hypothetical protein
METAINELKIKLETFEHNEPIQRAEGRTEDADRSAKGAAEVRQALAVLQATDGKWVKGGDLYVRDYMAEEHIEIPSRGLDLQLSLAVKQACDIVNQLLCECGVGVKFDLAWTNIPDAIENPDFLKGRVHALAYRPV